MEGVAPRSFRPLAPAVFLVYFALWGLANLPALRSAWWYLDDFVQTDVGEAENVAKQLRLGRPGHLVWVTSFWLDGNADRKAANVALRLFQGAIHAANATLIAGVLFGETGRLATLLAGLPFLLFAHNGEPVLWRTTGAQPASALLGLAAVYVLRRSARLRLGGPVAFVLVVAGALTYQLDACAGLVVWILALGLALLRAEPVARVRRGRELAVLLLGYLVGGLLSYAIAVGHGPAAARVRPLEDLGQRPALLAELNHKFLLETFEVEPAALRWLHVAFPFAAGLVVVAALATGRPAPRRALFAVLCVMTAYITPYAALLPINHSDRAWRLFYLAPLAFSGTWAVVDAGLAHTRLARGVVCVALATIVVAYAHRAWASVGVYPLLYEKDRDFVARADALAQRQGLKQLGVLVYDVRARDAWQALNPHGLDFRGGGLKISALVMPWSAQCFAAWVTRLPIVKNAAGAGCATACDRDGDRQQLRYAAAPASATLCLCAPMAH